MYYFHRIISKLVRYCNAVISVILSQILRSNIIKLINLLNYIRFINVEFLIIICLTYGSGFVILLYNCLNTFMSDKL